MAFDAWRFLSYFGVEGIKQARNDNVMAHCPDFEGKHGNGDRKRSFGILEKSTWDRRNSQWTPAGTSNCYVCGGFTLEQLTAKFLSRNLGRPVNDLEAYNWLMEQDLLPEDDEIGHLDELALDLKVLMGEISDSNTYDIAVLDEYLKALHPQALRRDGQQVLSVEMVRDVFQIGYCERSQRTVIPVFNKKKGLMGVISRATRDDDFIRYGVGVPDETFPNPGWKMMLDFPKGDVVFNEDKWDPFNKDTILVIESPMDVPYAYMHKIQEQVDIGAIMGAKPSREHVDKIAQYENVILGLDNDEAGATGTEFLKEELKRRKNRIWTFDSYGNKDLGGCTPEQVANLLQRVRKDGII